MNGLRAVLNERCVSAARRLTASPLFPWFSLIAQIQFAAFSIGLLSDQPFEVRNIGWFGWLVAPVTLLNAAIIAVRLFRKQPIA